MEGHELIGKVDFLNLLLHVELPLSKIHFATIHSSLHFLIDWNSATANQKLPFQGFKK